MRRYCCVFGCLTSTVKNPELAFFSLPVDRDRRIRWLRLINRDDLSERPSNQYYVCEKHFHGRDMLESANRKVLKRGTLPTMNLPTSSKQDKEVQASVYTTNVFVQTQKFLSDNVTQTRITVNADNIRKKKLQAELAEIKKEIKTYQNDRGPEKSQKEFFNKLCDRFLSKNLADLIKAQTNLKCHHTGNRYPLAYKIFCLNLYNVSPQAYKLLEKSFFLPCTKTLNKLYVPVSTKISDDLMSVLKIKVKNMSDIAKHCSVVIDTINVKCSLYYDIKNDKIIGFREVDGMQSPIPAKSALVVIVQGLFVNWMQPIGFAFMSECQENDNDISNWIDTILIKLLEIGLKIRTFVSDVGPVSLQLAEKRYVSVERPYFFVNNSKINYIFDAHHLIKILRNDFLKYHFIFQGGFVAKFDHVKQFYEQDKTKSLRIADKLTENHLNPKKSEKFKVSYAKELFSKPVASGISMYVDFSAIEVTGRDTVKFIQMMDDLYNALNSATSCGEDSQVMFLYNMLNFFYSLKLINPKNGTDVTHTAKFIQGFQITIKSILVLIEDLKQEGHKSLQTNRLNQDGIKAFFNKIRSQECIGAEPTSRQFVPAFRKLYFSYMLNRSKGSRADDASKFLTKLNELTSSMSDTSQMDESSASCSKSQANEVQEISSSDYSEIDIPAINPLIHISDFLIKKCSIRHENCESFKTYFSHTIDSELNLRTLNFHEFLRYVETMETVFRQSFNTQHLDVKIGSSIYERIKILPFTLPCPCFPIAYLQKLFVRMRLFLTIKYNNGDFRKHRIKKEKHFTVNNF